MLRFRSLKRAITVAAPELRIVSDALWQSAKDRQRALHSGPTNSGTNRARPALLRPTASEISDDGQDDLRRVRLELCQVQSNRFGRKGASKKGPTFCGKHLTIRQDDLDARILSGLASQMMRDSARGIS